MSGPSRHESFGAPVKFFSSKLLTSGKPKSEKVLRVVNPSFDFTTYSKSNEVFGSSHSQTLNESKKSVEDIIYLRHAHQISDELKKLRTSGSKVNHRLRFAKLEELLAKRTSELQTELKKSEKRLIEKQDVISKLEKENAMLEKNLSTVCDFIQERYETGTIEPHFGFVRMSKREAMRRFEDAVTKMQLSIYKDENERLKNLIAEESYKVEIIQCMETVLSDLKLENCCLKTGLVETEHSFECYEEGIARNMNDIDELKSKVEIFFNQMDLRLTRAFDKLDFICKKKKIKLKI